MSTGIRRAAGLWLFFTGLRGGKGGEEINQAACPRLGVIKKDDGVSLQALG